ncbi:MAG: hypothetical protein N3D20_03305, partial [Candidatus Pacearchaeota archaeon]|nr:hypothetical protein [Candidatus Pacearchaeota archaeon]
MAKKNLKSIVAAGLVGLGSLMPRGSNADWINLSIDTGGSNPNLEGSTMFLRNMEGGELGVDDYDNWLWPGRPPGSPPIWLRVYSDQFKTYYGVEVPLWIDARPYDGSDMNQPFPLRADVQGLNPGQTINASNCKFVFQAQNGYGSGGSTYR